MPDHRPATPVHHEKKPQPGSQHTALQTHEAKRKAPPYRTWYTELSNIVENTWLIEYASVALSIACLVTIIAILSHFSNQASTTWHSKLSINTVLSIVATAMKSAALLAAASALGQSKWAWYSQPNRSLQDYQLFDSASRGPLGSLLLILRLPVWRLATIGAVVTIISLASDAAVQASTTQPLRPVRSAGALVPSCHDYSNPNSSSSDGDALFNSPLYTAVYNAQAGQDELLATGKSTSSQHSIYGYNVSPTCQTGNCSYSHYASLGSQYQCSDITNQLRLAPGSNATFETFILPNSSSNGNPIFDLTATLASPTTSDLAGYTQINTSFTYPPYYISSPDAAPDQVLHGFKDFGLGTVTMITFNGDGIYNKSIFPFFAHNCTMRLALQPYSASVSDGVFIETPHDPVLGPWSFNSSNYKWSLKATIGDKEHMVQVSHTYWMTMTANLGRLFDSNYAEGVNTSSIPDAGKERAISVLLIDAAQNYQGIGVKEVFEHLTRSISYFFRIRSNQTATGITLDSEQYVHVRWPWLLVPAIMVVINVVFVIATHLQSRKYALPSWRTHALAGMLNETFTDHASTAAGSDEYVLVGPPAIISRISELEEWARTKSGTLRMKEG